VRKLKKSFSELEKELGWSISITDEDLIKVKHPHKKYEEKIEPQICKNPEERNPLKKLSWLEQQKADARSQRARIVL